MPGFVRQPYQRAAKGCDMGVYMLSNPRLDVALPTSYGILAGGTGWIDWMILCSCLRHVTRIRKLIVLAEERSALGLRLHAISRSSWRDCARIRYHTVAACRVTEDDEPEKGGLKIGCRRSERLDRGRHKMQTQPTAHSPLAR